MVANRALGPRGLRRTASPRPLGGGGDGGHRLVERMRAPALWPAATPALPSACIVRAGRRSGGPPGPPTSCHTLDGLGAALGLFGWGGGGGGGCLRGSRPGGHNEETEVCPRASPLSVCHVPPTPDTVPLPAPWRGLARPSRLGE